MARTGTRSAYRATPEFIKECQLLRSLVPGCLSSLLSHLAKSFFPLAHPPRTRHGLRVAGKIWNLIFFRPHSNGLMHHSWQSKTEWGGGVRKEGQGHTHLRDQEIEMCAFIHSSQHSFIEKCLLIPYVVFLWVPGPGQG